MRAVDIIKSKRDGLELKDAQIQWLIEAYTNGTVGDDQMAAFAMAVFFRSMTPIETASLTEAMMNSGNVMQLDDIAGLKVDKHSTGGVGDKISICLAPLVAACGVPVPMISGRGLGHTGGTLDKLSAIPGFTVEQDDQRFRELVRENNCALIGQTSTLAPADKRLYALRDVTATVESIPLICASILSKKMAEGIDGLVLDVKSGSGAFMKNDEEARALASTLVSVGTQMGRKVRALITSMDQVLGHACGNANETQEAIEVLKGRGPKDVVELTVELGAEMLVLGEVAQDIEDGRRQMNDVIENGKGLDQMAKIIEAQGGNPAVLDDGSTLMPQAEYITTLEFESPGFISGFDVEAVGRSAMLLGAGRARTSDEIDLGVGLEITAKVGDKVEKGQVFAHIAYNDSRKLEVMQPVLKNAVRISEEPTEALELIKERL